VSNSNHVWSHESQSMKKFILLVHLETETET
jgi:hypothetical protein